MFTNNFLCCNYVTNKCLQIIVGLSMKLTSVTYRTEKLFILVKFTEMRLYLAFVKCFNGIKYNSIRFKIIRKW